MIRLADSLPPYCASCFNQENVRHVDFDATIDRGYGNDPDMPVPIDWLQLCENCVKEAGRALGMTDDAELKAENERLEEERDAAKKEARKQSEYAARLEDVFDSRPEQIKVDHRLKPRER